MKISPDCISCITNQAITATHIVTNDAVKQKEILNYTLKLLSDIPEDRTPPEVVQKIHHYMNKTYGNTDPFVYVKRDTNDQVLRLVPKIKRIINNSNDPLQTAVKFSIIGNLIDSGLGETHFNIKDAIQTSMILKSPFFQYDQFHKNFMKASSILFLGDNSGEIVFDRLLIELMKEISDAKITYVVRGYPILNDATMEDADYVGLSNIVSVISNGCDAPGTILSQVGEKIIDLFNRSDMIISKGQGNYETLNESPYSIYFLFKIKCKVVAEQLGALIDSHVLMHKHSLNNCTSKSNNIF